MVPKLGQPPGWARSPEGAAKAMRILVIDDERRVAEFICRGLKEAGYRAEAATTAAAALKKLEADDYDLLILDLMLPDMDGLELLAKVRERAESPPVLILSALGAVDDRVKGLERGADDYLGKPFSFAELLARVRALLRRGKPEAERLQVADLVLDCVRRKVTRGGQPIELAPKEFSILEFMMRNVGRTLSRGRIVAHVWDMDYDGLTNIVDVYVRHLRGKVDDAWPKKLIHTVRGVGYMLEVREEPAKRARR